MSITDASAAYQDTNLFMVALVPVLRFMSLCRTLDGFEAQRQRGGNWACKEVEPIQLSWLHPGYTHSSRC